MKHFKLFLEDELHKQLKLCSVASGKTMQEIVVESIKSYLKNEYKGDSDNEKRGS